MHPAFALLTVLLLATPGAALAPVPRAEAPEGCAREGETWRCAWTVDTRSPDVLTSTSPSLRREIPLFPSTVATITVRLDGEDRGWNLVIVQWPEGRNGSSRIVSVARHAAPLDGQTFHAETSTHVLRQGSEHPHDLILSFSDYNVAGAEVFGVGPPSMGVFHVTYTALALPAGSVPSRPAATREDPHLADAAEDARRPELDVLASWLDDARLGDGLLDVHLAVTSLDSPTFDETAPGLASALSWESFFRTPTASYRMLWFLGNDGTFTCNLRRDSTFTATSIVAIPECTLDAENATLSAVFPEGAIGAPGPGTPIVLESASSFTFAEVRASEDVGTGTRYAFAPGGPAEWSALNPRLDPPPAAALAWYADPLASDNLPDTLQVAGAALAVLTFLGSIFLLRRTRKQTQRLLAQVDLLVREHEANTRGALLALGKLEAEFDALYRGGRINETQYQLAAARITSAAARFALRREMGLDDGTPGETPSRNVPVRDGAHEREAKP